MGVGWLERVCERESSELSGMYDFETASYGLWLMVGLWSMAFSEQHMLVKIYTHNTP